MIFWFYNLWAIKCQEESKRKGLIVERTIYLAGGCFWGIQGYFDLLHGIVATRVGYANSRYENPNYELVCTGITNATEAIEILYDDKKIGLDCGIISNKDSATLDSDYTICGNVNKTIDYHIPDCILSRFFSIINPSALNYQGNDRGTQYRSGIYATDVETLSKIQYFIQQYIAPIYKGAIVVEVMLLENFYEAEEYHQKYLIKNPHGYCHIDMKQALQPLSFKHWH